MVGYRGWSGCDYGVGLGVDCECYERGEDDGWSVYFDGFLFLLNDMYWLRGWLWRKVVDWDFEVFFVFWGCNDFGNDIVLFWGNYCNFIYFFDYGVVKLKEFFIVVLYLILFSSVVSYFCMLFRCGVVLFVKLEV